MNFTTNKGSFVWYNTVTKTHFIVLQAQQRKQKSTNLEELKLYYEGNPWKEEDKREGREVDEAQRRGRRRSDKWEKEEEVTTF